MSSTYSVLCLSHDPAIIVHDPGYNRPEQAEAAVRDGVTGHEHCDLMIGRYSYPLVELGCPATRDQPAQLRCCHSGTSWTDKDWLLLLTAAYQSTDPTVLEAIKAGYHGCLPWERLSRLRIELGVTLKEQP
ncbi:hypothetical protein AB0C88_37725 [Streptomyces chartreusis]|uniref:hypothetical protein n=1 Tax=Streptomyces chartreusis TaxID=1969 RepID=UPI00340593E8